MGLTFNNEKFRLVVVLSLIFALFASFAFSPVAKATEVSSKEEAEKLAQTIYESSTYQEDTKTFEFDENKAVSLGLDQQVANQISNYYEGLSEEEAVALNELQEEEEGPSTRVAPLIIWAAGILASAGLGWLADKLLDYGAQKFCDAYRNENAVTKTVCDVIAPK